MKYTLGKPVIGRKVSEDLTLRIGHSSGVPLMWWLTKEAEKAYPLIHLFSTIRNNPSISMAIDTWVFKSRIT